MKPSVTYAWKKKSIQITFDQKWINMKCVSVYGYSIHPLEYVLCNWTQTLFLDCPWWISKLISFCLFCSFMLSHWLCSSDSVLFAILEKTELEPTEAVLNASHLCSCQQVSLCCSPPSPNLPPTGIWTLVVWLGNVTTTFTNTALTSYATKKLTDRKSVV